MVIAYSTVVLCTDNLKPKKEDLNENDLFHFPSQKVLKEKMRQMTSSKECEEDFKNNFRPNQYLGQDPLFRLKFHQKCSLSHSMNSGLFNNVLKKFPSQKVTAIEVWQTVRDPIEKDYDQQLNRDSCPPFTAVKTGVSKQHQFFDLMINLSDQIEKAQPKN